MKLQTTIYNHFAMHHEGLNRKSRNRLTGLRLTKVHLLFFATAATFLWQTSRSRNQRGSFTVVALSSYTTPVLSSERFAVEEQLGYLPSNFLRVSAWRIASEDSDGDVSLGVPNNSTASSSIPIAIQTYPLQGGAKRRQMKASLVPAESRVSDIQSPFPTLYWLTCPQISRAVANLERKGFIQTLQDRIQHDEQLATRLIMCHHEYAQRRWKSLTHSDRRSLLQAEAASPLGRMRAILQQSGISGSNLTSPSSLTLPFEVDVLESGKLSQVSPFRTSEGTFVVPPIKCLHAHYAQYLSWTPTQFSRCSFDVQCGEDTRAHSMVVSQDSSRTSNPVGELIHEELLKNEYSELWRR